MKAAQHLALLQPVSTTTLTTSYTTTFTINRQAGTLLILSVKRPVTGRDGLGTMEGEDYDGQSGATKEDSNDTDLGQSISVTSGGSIFYDVVDFSDAGVGSVQMRVNAVGRDQPRVSRRFGHRHAARQVRGSATSGAWATQSCTLTPISGVHTLYVVFDGAAHLNWLLFQPASSSTTGTGGSGAGTGGSSGTGGAGGKSRRHRRHGNDGHRRHGAHRHGRHGNAGTGGTGTTGTGGAIVSGAGGTGRRPEPARGGGTGTGGTGSGLRRPAAPDTAAAPAPADRPRPAAAAAAPATSVARPERRE